MNVMFQTRQEFLIRQRKKMKLFPKFYICFHLILWNGSFFYIALICGHLWTQGVLGLPEISIKVLSFNVSAFRCHIVSKGLVITLFSQSYYIILPKCFCRDWKSQPLDINLPLFIMAFLDII